MNSSNYQQFFDLIKDNDSSIVDGELVVEMGDNIAFDLKSVLQAVGYKFDDNRTVRGQSFHISLNAAMWTGKGILFESWEALFKIVANASSLPEYFYVIDSNISSLDYSVDQKRLELFCSVRKLLVALADHCEPNQGQARGSKKLFFVIETDDGVIKYEFNPSLSWASLQSIDVDESKLNAAKKLISLTEVGDSQDSERRSVMRSAFHELISGCYEESEIFDRFIISVPHFHKRYEEHHDLFVRRFSINKVLHEINEQDLTYTSKINEIISGAQNKALAIPGALIVIGAVMKIDQLLDGIAVAVGIIMTTIIVQRSLSVYSATFDHIGKQVNSEFKRYDVLNEEVEIRQQAKDTKGELTGLIKKAKDNTRFINISIWVICVFALWFIYSVTSSLPQRETESTSTIPATEAPQPAETTNEVKESNLNSDLEPVPKSNEEKRKKLEKPEK